LINCDRVMAEPVPRRLPPSDLVRIWTWTKQCAPTTKSRVRVRLTCIHRRVRHGRSRRRWQAWAKVGEP